MSAGCDLLVVEDDERDLEMTLRALRKALIVDGIAIARDGVEALEFLFCEGPWSTRRIEDAPRLVLLDLKLPRVDGLEVLQRLHADPRTRTIPVVALSSSREQIDVAASYGLGVNSYIVKPVGFDAFTTAVGQLGIYWMLLNQPPGAPP